MTPENQNVPVCGLAVAQCSARTTPVPGIKACHRWITDTCRSNRTDLGAMHEAVTPLQMELLRLFDVWPRGKNIRFHLVLTVEEMDSAACKNCDGRGYMSPNEDGDELPCQECGGSGFDKPTSPSTRADGSAPANMNQHVTPLDVAEQGASFPPNDKAQTRAD